jgi:sodium-dependent dicarboxylate transporter 2/3/5
MVESHTDSTGAPSPSRALVSPPAADEADVSGFDLWRQRAGFVLAPLAFAWVWALTGALEPAAHRLAAILAAVVVLWITEAIPMAVTALLGVSAAVALRVAPASEAFGPFGDPLIFVFVGTFMLARAIVFHGLDRRFAFAILRLPGLKARPGRLLAAYAAVACAMSMLVDSAATTAMMMPIGFALLRAMGLGGGEHGYATALLLATAFASTVGGLATPIGAAPNLIGIGFIRREIGVPLPFFSWVVLGLPVAALLLVWVVVHLWHESVRMDGGTPRVGPTRFQSPAPGPWTRGQVNTLVACAATATLWFAPGVLDPALGHDHPLCRGLATALPEGVAAMIGTSLLFVLPTDLGRHRFTLPWSEAVQIDWWIVFLYGGGIALGTLSFHTGLAAVMGAGLTGHLAVHAGFGLLLLATSIATLLSEATSNAAAANMVIPVVIASARSVGVDPLLPTLGATMGASLGFMLPVSTPANAIVYGSGRVPLRAMVRCGFALDVVGVAIIVAVLSLLGPLLGVPRV